MKTPHTRPLALEPIEDRLTPSRAWVEPAPPRPDEIVAVAPRAFAPVAIQPRVDTIAAIPPRGLETPVGQTDGLRPTFGFGDRIDPRDLRVRESADAVQLQPVAFLPWWNPAHPTDDTAGNHPEEQSTAEKAPTPPAALHELLTAPSLRNTVPTSGRAVAANISDREPAMVSAIVPGTPPLPPMAEAQVIRPISDRPVAPTVDNSWPVVFVGSIPDTVESVPATASARPEAPKATPTPIEEAPAPSLVERAIEAVLPGGTPFHGVLPLAEEWIETGVTDLLAGIECLGEDAVGGVPLWEQATWLAGAVLVLGGVTYTVRMNRGRRQLDRAVIGTDSALARWEDKNARRTTG